MWRSRAPRANFWGVAYPRFVTQTMNAAAAPRPKFFPHAHNTTHPLPHTQKMGVLRELRPGEPVRGDCVLYFTAEWCGPCQALKPAVAAVARDAPCDVVLVDVDAHGALAEAHGVGRVPTLRVLRGGRADTCHDAQTLGRLLRRSA
jgi:thiol-disulfide isomerase/thioredoxin